MGASRLLTSRPKILTLTSLVRPLFPPFAVTDQSVASCHTVNSCRSPSQPSDHRRYIDSISKTNSYSPTASSFLFARPKRFEYVKSLNRSFCMKSHGVPPISSVYDSTLKKDTKNQAIVAPKTNPMRKEVLCFSPLEKMSTNVRSSGLSKESSKVKRMELSQRVTFALIPALILISKSSVTTSLLIFSVYWQIYGFFREIFLDYVHHEVTRTWVLTYFKILLLILAKDTIIHFGLV